MPIRTMRMDQMIKRSAVKPGRMVPTTSPVISMPGTSSRIMTRGTTAGKARDTPAISFFRFLNRKAAISVKTRNRARFRMSPGRAFLTM